MSGIEGNVRGVCSQQVRFTRFVFDGLWVGYLRGLGLMVLGLMVFRAFKAYGRGWGLWDV